MKKSVKTNTDSNQVMVDWNRTHWKQVEKTVFRLQKRIYQASSRGDEKAVRRLQKTLMRSWSGKMLAVRKVTQDNQGKKTAGIDGMKSLTPKQRLELVLNLKLDGKAKPLRRVWIPKPGTDEQRPLGIPTIEDRAKQALVKLALEPEWEARFEPNSYGFRPGRSCHDAVNAIYIAINKKAKYVLDADIAKCFDRINQEKLLEKLNTFPTLRRQVNAWLKSGVMDGNELFPTHEGTPQGGVISPLLANIALHGMENRLMEYAETWKGRKKENKKSLSLIRYADDFIILHKDLNVVMECKRIIEAWLKDMGLELKPSKTRIAHTLECHEQERSGFDFLGFEIRQHPVGKHQSGTHSHGKKLGFKTIIKPSKKAIKEHYRTIAEILENQRTAPQHVIIDRLNPIIVGWSNYYATVCSKEIYSRMDNMMYWKLKKWATRRHPNKPKSWVANKYWGKSGNRNWSFQTSHIQLKTHAETPIQRHVKVRNTASIYDGNWTYWSQRMSTYPEASTRVKTLLKRQEGRCPECGLMFNPTDTLEVDHIVPLSIGGKDRYDNLQLLHRHCHDVKTARDGRRGAYDKRLVVEEPDEMKVSRPVLKTSGQGDLFA